MSDSTGQVQVLVYYKNIFKNQQHNCALDIHVANNDNKENTCLLHTLSGRLLASAILAIGSADVFDAKIQCSGIC
jgi:hypothetical protein